jgi:hypothetical protein
MNRLLLLWPVAILLSACSPHNKLPHSYIPSQGYVPNEQTAIKIAEAVCLPIYGEEQLSKERPLTAELRNTVWVVSGSLPRTEDGAEAIGGTIEVQISKKDARILRLSHGE